MPTSPRPLRLSDDQLDTVHRAATPLPIADRSAFLQLVAELLWEEHTLGDGVVAKAAATAQRHFLQPARLAELRELGGTKGSKYNRRQRA